MSKRSDALLIFDILESIEKIFQYTAALDEKEFLQNSEKSDAVIRNIEVIGEASSKLSAEFQARHSEIPWAQIVSMRNRLIHGYFGISLPTIWQVVCVDIPELYEKIRRLPGIIKPES